MSNAARDGNYVTTIIAALNTNGTTVTRVKADAVTHALQTNDGITGSDHGPVDDLRDENYARCWMAVSSTDGKTPVVCYADASGKLLVKST